MALASDRHPPDAKIERGPSAWHHYDRHPTRPIEPRIEVNVSGPKVVPLSIRRVCSQKPKTLGSASAKSHCTPAPEESKKPGGSGHRVAVYFGLIDGQHKAAKWNMLN